MFDAGARQKCERGESRFSFRHGTIEEFAGADRCLLLNAARVTFQVRRVE